MWEYMTTEKNRRNILRKAQLEEAGDLAAAYQIKIETNLNTGPKPPTFFDLISKDDECCIR
jgi:hypothetical protein